MVKIRFSSPLTASFYGWTSVAVVFMIHQVAASVHKKTVARAALPSLMGHVICTLKLQEICWGWCHFFKA